MPEALLADTLPEHADALPVGARLGEFEVLSILGAGGFGIVYRAMDHSLQREVALKEYLPSSLAGRSDEGMVSVRSRSNVETYQLGLSSFINEARLLARFDHPSLVKVYRFWEDNGTAYMVMPFYRGQTLKELRKTRNGPPDEAWLRTLVDPLLGALEALHAEGVVHRDVAPDNILVGEDGRPVLLDFGAARRAIGDQTQTLTTILKPNFAPIEQYADATQMRQGPWTDLYALAATLHHLITGNVPPPAAARMLQDDLPPLTSLPLPGCSQPFLRALDWAMGVRPEDRPQSVGALREALHGEALSPISPAPPERDAAKAPAPAPVDAWAATTQIHDEVWMQAHAAPDVVLDTQASVEPPQEALERRRYRWALAAVGAGLFIAFAAIGWALRPSSPAAAPVPSATAAPEVHSVVPSARAAAAKDSDLPPQETVHTSPREACGSRRFVAMLMCMQRQGETTRYRQHPQCQKLREEEARRARRTQEAN